MAAHSHTRAHQHPDDLGQTHGYLPVPYVPKPGKQSRLTPLRRWWNSTWTEGLLYRRWEELRQAPRAGWHGMANWVKALLAIAAACSVIILLNAAADIAGAVLNGVFPAVPAVQPPGTDTTPGMWGVIDNPIRSYIGQHSASLTVSGSAVYLLWQLAGLFGLIGGFARSTGARVTWTLWGAASIAMVWSASPTSSRTVATAIAVLAWTLASMLALRGLRLRPRWIAHIHTAPIQIRSEIHLPAVTARTDDTADDVHTLQC